MLDEFDEIDDEEEIPPDQKELLLEGVNRFTNILIYLLTLKRENKDGFVIAEKLEIVSQAPASISRNFSVLITEKENNTIEFTVSSSLGLDIIRITTTLQVKEVYSLLKKNKKLDIFSMRISSISDAKKEKPKQQQWFMFP